MMPCGLAVGSSVYGRYWVPYFDLLWGARDADGGILSMIEVNYSRYNVNDILILQDGSLIVDMDVFLLGAG